MTAMNNNTLYLMNARAVCDMNYSGIPVDVTANPISIVPGWNWVAYQPQEAQTSSQALSSLTPSNLDYVKNQTRSTTYYAGYGWFGTLSQMSPGEGYMMNIASAGTLIFPEGASAKKSLYIDEDLTGYVDFNPYNFEFNGTITAEVNLSDMEISSEDVLIAYVNGECRGQVRGWYFEPTDKIVFPMMVYSNTAEGDELSFTYYSSLADEYYLCAEAMHFTQDMVTGDAEYPVVLTVSGVSNVNHSRPVTEFSVYPNPSAGNISVTFNIPGRSNVKLELIDITGKLVSCLVDEVFENGNYTLDLQKLNIIEGVYYLRFVLNETSCVQQITIIN